MASSTSHAVRHSLVALTAATVFAACADRAPAGPQARSVGAPSGATLTTAEVQAAASGSLPDLGTCTNLQVPEGSTVSFHVFGKGVQIYSWNSAELAWKFVDPDADLFADPEGNARVGTHFHGPTWQTVSGSTVVGTIAADGRCTPNPNAIAWLKLDAAPDGTGVFDQTTFIQRLNTVGGNAPGRSGHFNGEVVRVRYTADYYFYRAP